MDFKYDIEEALERTGYKLPDIEELRKQPNASLTGLSDKYLLLFINACNGNMEEADNLIKLFLNARKNTPEHFKDRDPLDPKIEQCLQNQFYVVIPPTKDDDCPIVYHQLANNQPSNYIFDNAVKTFCMTIDVALYKYGPRPGVIFIQDMRNVCFGHTLRAGLSSIRKFLFYIQNCVLAKVRRIHVTNVTSLFNRILSILKPFLKKELLEMIHIHESTDDYSDFHRTWIPKSHLPSDFGGDLKSVQDLHEEFVKEFRDLREFFLNEEKKISCIEL